MDPAIGRTGSDSLARGRRLAGCEALVFLLSARNDVLRVSACMQPSDRAWQIGSARVCCMCIAHCAYTYIGSSSPKVEDISGGVWSYLHRKWASTTQLCHELLGRIYTPFLPLPPSLPPFTPDREMILRGQLVRSEFSLPTWERNRGKGSGRREYYNFRDKKSEIFTQPSRFVSSCSVVNLLELHCKGKLPPLILESSERRVRYSVYVDYGYNIYILLSGFDISLGDLCC